MHWDPSEWDDARKRAAAAHRGSVFSIQRLRELRRLKLSWDEIGKRYGRTGEAARRFYREHGGGR